jgi:predicted secreted protein
MRTIFKQLTPGSLIFLLALLICSAAAQAITYQGAPQLINYQGRLTDGAGTPLSDGPHSVQFRIWDDSTLTGAPHLLWDSGPLVVTTDKGIFTVKLGTPPQPSLGLNTFYDTSIFVGITVGADPEIAPRTRLTSVPFAMSAQYATSAQSAGTAYYLDPSTMPAAGTIYFNLNSITSTSAATMGSFTVQAPGPGYLTINASGEMYIDADATSANSLTTYFYLSLNSTPNSFGSFSSYINPYISDPDNVSGNSQTTAYSLNATFSVFGGPVTFYLNGATSNSSYPLNPWSYAMVTVLFTPGTLSISSPTQANPDQKPPKQE